EAVPTMWVEDHDVLRFSRNLQRFAPVAADVKENMVLRVLHELTKIGPIKAIAGMELTESTLFSSSKTCLILSSILYVLLSACTVSAFCLPTSHTAPRTCK
ncbi:hypothetical protein GCK32_012402, partial [Trichostrongylus colubriformis]